MSESVDSSKEVLVIRNNTNWELLAIHSFMIKNDTQYFISYKQSRNYLFEISDNFLPFVYLCKISTIELLYDDEAIKSPYIERMFESIDNSMSPYDEAIIRNIDQFWFPKSGVINSYPKPKIMPKAIKTSVFKLSEICGFDILQAIEEFKNSSVT